MPARGGDSCCDGDAATPRRGGRTLRRRRERGGRRLPVSSSEEDGGVSKAETGIAGLRHREGEAYWGASFSATRSRADRALGFRASSWASGRMARRVRRRSEARWAQVQKGCWGGHRQF